jgi:hypothetical protein
MTDTPKLWRDMTPEEKGALLLAHHEGQYIQSFGVFVPDMWWGDLPEWEDKVAYRIKPEPKRETVTARLCIDADGTSLYMETSYPDRQSGEEDFNFILTFDTLDGKVDPASIKIEELTQ